jgi:hypothetical protein
LAGLGSGGEKVRLLRIIDVSKLLAGRGGEEELSYVVIIFSAPWRVYLYCFCGGGSTSKLLLSASHGGEGEGGNDDAATTSLKWRIKSVPWEAIF